MRCNPFIVVFMSLTVIVMGLMVLPGCRNKAAAPEPVKPTANATESPAALPQEEVQPPTASPFQKFADATSGTLTAASADKVADLHIPGIVLLGICMSVWYLTRSWKTTLLCFGLGVAVGACGVLLSDFPKVVLLIPLCGLAVLIAYGVKVVFEWFTGYRAWKAVSTEIESADTGSFSLGQLIKDRFKEAGLAPVLDKALGLMEKIWKVQPPKSVE